MSSIEQRINVGVAAVITNDEGEFLLGKRGKGTFAFPGGKPDPGESPDEAVLRELKEETGIEAGFAQPLGVWTYDRHDEDGIHYVTLYFIVGSDDQEPVAGWEFYSAEQAYNLPLSSGVPRVIQIMAGAWA